MLKRAAMVAVETTGLARISIGMRGSSAARIRMTNKIQSTKETASVPMIQGDDQGIRTPPSSSASINVIVASTIKIEPGISPDGYHRFHYEELEYFAAQRYDQLGSSVLFPVNEFTVPSLLIYAFVAFLGDESELGKKILEFSIERKLVTSDNAFQLYSAAFKLKKTNPINLGKQDLFFVRHFFNPIDWQDWDKKIAMD